MSASPGTWLVVAAFGILFLGGAVAGLGLAAWLAPGSWLAEAVGLLALPVAFALGLQAWYGLALLGLIPRLLGRLRSSDTAPVRPAASAIPGSMIFLPISSGVGALSGLLVGLVSPTQPVWLVAAVYWVVGTAHGTLGWQLARRGWLMPPDSI